MTATPHGIVLRAQSGQYVVLDDVGTLECRARRRLRRPEPTWPEFPVPGDDVEWRLLGGAGTRRQGIIEAVRPRRSEISRSRFGSKHVVVANLDRLVVAIAIREPTLERGLLDRLLAIAERSAIPAVVCFNKVDLVDTSELGSLRTTYEKAGYTVLFTSAETHAGVEDLREHLRGHTSAFVGPSGAGKSRLIDLLQPGLKLRMGAVSEKTGQGKHTTTRVDLHRTEFGALLADTPGFRDFILWRLEPNEARNLFPELRALQDGCRFGECIHLNEPQCAVKAAVEAGSVDGARYRSYVAMVQDSNEQRAGADREGRSRKERSKSW